MTISKRSVTILLTLALGACGKSDSGDSDDHSGTPSTGPVGEITDSSSAGIVAFLKAGTYRDWTTKQAAPIDAVSSHASKTQTYFNDTAGKAAKASQVPLPKDGVIVKEIYESDGMTLRGHAVMAKVADGTGGESWLWFEGFLPEYSSPYYGIGHSTCTGCHQAGTDFIRTAVP